MELIVSVARVYKDKSSAHVLGYVSQVSSSDLKNREYLKEMSVPGIATGKTGLERRLDKEIIGKVGFQRYEVNAFGKRIRTNSSRPRKAGKSFKTTLDLEIQKYVEEILKDKAASVCVMDIYNGDIISMVSSPSYDPNKFVHGISQLDWNKLIKE